MSIIASLILGAIAGAVGTHYWHKKHPPVISINPRPDTGGSATNHKP